MLLPSEVAFKRISPSAITVVQKCQLFWLLKRVPDRRTPRGAMALWSLVPAAAAAAAGVHEARQGCQVPATATAGRFIIIGCRKSRPQANIGQFA